MMENASSTTHLYNPSDLNPLIHKLATTQEILTVGHSWSIHGCSLIFYVGEVVQILTLFSEIRFSFPLMSASNDADVQPPASDVLQVLRP